MNTSIVIYFLSWVLKIEGILMILPCVTAAVYREKDGFCFAAVAVACLILGVLGSYKKPENTVFYAREGFVAVSLSWVVLSFFGAMPFYISGAIPNLEDALFEVISGFTTTGASILPDVESLSRCMLIWRSFTHWIGGMGVLVFLLTVLPVASGYNMHIMKAESPGPSVGKLVPRVKTTAKILYTIYFAMTLVQIVLLLLGGMPVFDTLCISFGTAGTGGFGILSDSIGSYSLYLQAVTTVFMILFGINFNVYYLFLIKKPKDAVRCEEARVYLGIILAASLLIAWNVRGQFSNIGLAFHHALFQVGSIITTTGFSTVDFDLWPEFSKTILILLMLIGACAGSTGGGFKISRLIIIWKSFRREIDQMIHPRIVRVPKLDGKRLDRTVVHSVYIYLIAYVLILFVSVLLISVDGFDFTSNFSAVAATFNNIGPGLGEVGPMRNFAGYSAFSKYVMMFDMLAGRLEIFPMLVLFSWKTWKR